MARTTPDGYLEGNMMPTQLNLHVAFKRNEEFPNKKITSYMEDDSKHVYTYRGASLQVLIHALSRSRPYVCRVPGARAPSRERADISRRQARPARRHVRLQPLPAPRALLCDPYALHDARLAPPGTDSIPPAALIGAVLHTLNFRLFAEQIAYIVNHAEDVVIFAEGSLVNLLVRSSPHVQTRLHTEPICAALVAVP